MADEPEKTPVDEALVNAPIDPPPEEEESPPAGDPGALEAEPLAEPLEPEDEPPADPPPEEPPDPIITDPVLVDVPVDPVFAVPLPLLDAGVVAVLGEMADEEKTALQALSVENRWGAHQHFECSVCPFDTLSNAAMVAHVVTAHRAAAAPGPAIVSDPDLPDAPTDPIFDVPMELLDATAIAALESMPEADKAALEGTITSGQWGDYEHFACGVPGCQRDFLSHADLVEHLATEHQASDLDTPAGMRVMRDRFGNVVRYEEV